jgi:hypothetical protein
VDGALAGMAKELRRCCMSEDRKFLILFARHLRQLAGAWRKTYVISAVLALYFNTFVLIVFNNKNTKKENHHGWNT